MIKTKTNNLIKVISIVITVIFLALSFGCNLPTPPQTYTPLTADDFLTANGQDLYNKKGEKVILNGVNLGGWLHFEGWMDGGGYTLDQENEKVWMNHFAVRTALENRFSDSQVEQLLTAYQQNYITIDDLRFIRSLGLNFVRVPFFWTEILDGTGNVKPNAFDQLDWVIKECSNLGMYVLLDLHGAPGGQSNGAVTGGHTDSNELWTNETYQQWTVLLWQTVATRYKDNYAVYGYDLLNEPMPPDATTPPDADADVSSTTHDMYDMLYDAVREVDENHIIVLEAFWHCKFLGDPKDSGWENVVYQMHMYHDGDKTESAQIGFANYYIDYIKRYKEEWNVAFLVGEYNFWSAKSAWETWLNTWNTEGVSWCSWTYKNTDTIKDNNWGYYYNANVQNVDYANDSFDTIKQKWQNYSSSNYEKNEFLTNIIKDCAYYNTQEFGKRLDTTKFTLHPYQTAGEANQSNLIDGDNKTRWTNGEAQSIENSQHITVRFGEKIRLDTLRIFTPNMDYGREYKLSVVDANTGKTITIDCAGEIGYTDISVGVDTRAITITQTGTATNNFWSIHELIFYGGK